MIQPQVQKKLILKEVERRLKYCKIKYSLYLFFLSLFGSAEDGTTKPKLSVGLSFEEKSQGFVGKS